jgi:large subunit ribosomal protein L21
VYAIIQSGGKQYRVSEGDFVDVERLDGDVGQEISFDSVLLVGDQDQVHLGTPMVNEARVVATIADQGKGAKILVFKYKRRKMYRRKRGHRQLFTRVRIDQIALTAGEKKAKPVKAETVQKEKPESAVEARTEKKKTAAKKAKAGSAKKVKKTRSVVAKAKKSSTKSTSKKGTRKKAVKGGSKKKTK